MLLQLLDALLELDLLLLLLLLQLLSLLLKEESLRPSLLDLPLGRLTELQQSLSRGIDLGSQTRVLAREPLQLLLLDRKHLGARARLFSERLLRRLESLLELLTLALERLDDLLHLEQLAELWRARIAAAVAAAAAISKHASLAEVHARSCLQGSDFLVMIVNVRRSGQWCRHGV